MSSLETKRTTSSSATLPARELTGEDDHVLERVVIVPATNEGKTWAVRAKDSKSVTVQDGMIALTVGDVSRPQKIFLTVRRDEKSATVAAIDVAKDGIIIFDHQVLGYCLRRIEYDSANKTCRFLYCTEPLRHGLLATASDDRVTSQFQSFVTMKSTYVPRPLNVQIRTVTTTASLFPTGTVILTYNRKEQAISDAKVTTA